MEFFGAANTRKGFKSMFDSVFSDVKRLYILKGSSGCGKSTFMRRVALESQKLGMHTDLVYCSSDPESLDGVIVKELSLAVADGTAPHVMDVKYPCVRESIINFGEFWNERKLLNQSEKIINLTDRKAAHYKNAYRALGAAGKVSDMLYEHEIKAIDREALENHAFKLAEKLCEKENNGSIKQICTAAFGALGLTVKNTFGAVKTVYRVAGNGSRVYLSAVAAIARELGASGIVSLDPIDPVQPDSVYFAETDTLVTLRKDAPCQNAEIEKKINTGKFLCSGENNVKSGKRLLSAAEDALLIEAQREFECARNLHSAIEAIYIPAMDFNAVDEYTDAFCKRVVHN